MSIKVDVGTPPSNFEDWTTAEVRFHGFADLTTERDEPVESPEFSCLGHQWRVDLYPGGDEHSNDGYVAVRLSNMTNKKSIIIEWCCIVRDAASKEIVYHEPETDQFGGVGDDGVLNYWGQSTCDLCKRSALLDALIEGTLIIDVRMKLVESSKYSSQFIPDNPINNIILNQFNEEESADVVFEVGSGSKQGKGTRKKSKTSTRFYAHRFVLLGASTLAEMCKQSGGGDATTSVAITDVKPDIFKHMLYYLYGGKLTEEEFKANAKDIIDAADKYGVVSLKLEAEAFYVKSAKFAVENIIDNLLYADSKNLALLTEAVTDFIVENGDDILGKVSFDNVPGSTVADILAAMARGKKKSNDSNDDINYNKMRVCTLRKMLHDKRLDVDGSREAMIALLKENSKDSGSAQDDENE